MKYVVERVSESEEKPCDEARPELVLCTDERSVDSPDKIPFYKTNPDKWYKEAGYFNHRVENGHIKRDHYEPRWVVEIKDLAELHKFIAKYGRVIMTPPFHYGESLPNITIYDDYIE